MAPRVDAATLNVQPKKRRQVYEALAGAPAGLSVKELLRELDMPEVHLRESLRKLDDAGLVMRTNARWTAVPLETPVPASERAAEAV